MTIRISMCAYCCHFHVDDENRNTCDAFPEGIPREIVFGPRKHVFPVDGDHGIQFEPADNCPEWIVDLQQEYLAEGSPFPFWRRLVNHVRPEKALSQVTNSQEVERH
jgi:hypothetical protein